MSGSLSTWRQLRQRTKADEGMTLIELIIAMIILGVIMAPLATSLILGMTTTAGAIQHVENSTDAELVATKFSNDVASADDVSTSASCGSGDAIVEFRWTSATTPDAAPDNFATYAKIENTSAEDELHTGPATIWKLIRYVCTSSGTSSTVLARSLTQAPEVTCDGGSCAGAPKPKIVTLHVTEFGREFSNTYDYTVAGTRRARNQ